MLIGAATPVGLFPAVSKVLLASLWLWFTINGCLAARRRRLPEHRRDMIRSVTLALSIITNRIGPLFLVALQPLQDSVFRGNGEHFVWMEAGVEAMPSRSWSSPVGAVQ